MNNKKISICIPTYNREYYLNRLLKNIISQNQDQIEVVIVNDGSTDNTKNLIQHYNSFIQIRYFEQVNQGRSIALKKAIELASGEYVVIMDDEDYFTKKAFITIFKDLEKINHFIEKSNKPIIGVVYLTEDINGTILGNQFIKSPLVSNLVAINADYKSKGDKKQIIKTKYLKEHMYKTYNGERRIPTYLLWQSLSVNYNVIFFNKVVAVKEYLNEGLSKNINKVRMNSPKGSRMIYKELFELKNVYKSKTYRIKNAINFYRYNFHSNDKIEIQKKFIYNLVGYILGYILYQIDKFKYKR